MILYPCIVITIHVSIWLLCYGMSYWGSLTVFLQRYSILAVIKNIWRMLVENTWFSPSRESHYKKPSLVYRLIHYLLQWKPYSVNVCIKQRHYDKLTASTEYCITLNCTTDVCWYTLYTELARTEISQITLPAAYISRFELKVHSYS